MNILLIDEFFLQRRILWNLLHQAGYSCVLEAEEWPAALQILGREKVDLVILSWYRSSGSPSKFFKTLGPRQGWREVPLLVVLGAEEEDSLPKILRRRGSRFIIKPFSALALAEKIQEILALGEAAQNHFQLRRSGPPGRPSGPRGPKKHFYGR